MKNINRNSVFVNCYIKYHSIQKCSLIHYAEFEFLIQYQTPLYILNEYQI